MKRFLLTTATIAATTSTLLWGSTAQADYMLTILHTNDFHARFEPISKYDNGCSEDKNAEGKCFGGSARLVTAVADARKRSNNTILVDGGDQFQGTLFYTYYKGKVAAEMMNKLGYDAMTVGNHEFDDGPEVLRGFMDAVGFPVLMSNGDVTKEPALADKIRGSVVIERGGEKIGLIGVTPEDTHELASPGKNITFIDPAVAVNAEVAKLEAEGVNKIIVLSHSGYEVDKRIAAETKGVDVIVGGHSNTYLSNTSDRAKGPYPTVINGVQIVQAYAYGKFLGELNVTFDEAGHVVSAAGEPLIMDGEVVENSETKARIAELAVPLDEIRQKVVAKLGASVDGARETCRVQECEMGNLVADAMLARVKPQGVSIAFANSGGIRASLEAGDVTMGEVLSVLPFQNTLSTFELSGEGVLAALENGVSQVEEVKGRFPQVAGLKFTWDMSVAPNEGRISDVMVQEGDTWVALDPAKTYQLVTNDYVRNGGDGYKMFAGNDKKAYDYGPDLADVLVEYLVAKGDYTPAVEGRIQKK
ncbi:MAG: bifunctional metallophosphatase/5'-nucleotidase [Halocynthiibacter sp.]